MNLEELFTSSRHGFGVPASPVQRAICRAAEGRPLADLADLPDVLLALGGPGDEATQRAALESLPTVRPREVDVLAGIRGGKTRLGAAVALCATQIVDVTGLLSGEVPRFSFVSLKLDAATVAFDQLVGTILDSAILKKLLLEEPTRDSILVRHPSGRPIEIVTTAGARAGGGLVARWSAGVLFDEFTRMVGSEDGAVVNFDEARRAVLGRLLPGAQVISIGSPWAPFGPAYERAEEGWGKPTPERVVVRAPGPVMNPAWWTPERCESLRIADPIAYTTDVLGEFADPESSFISSTEIKRATRSEPMVLPPQYGRTYTAACDPGTRGNSWTLIVLAAYRDAEGIGRYEVALAHQWTGTPNAPLSPKAIFGETAKILRPYGLTWVAQDQHSADANRDLGDQVDLRVVPVTVGAGGSNGALYQNRNELYERLKSSFAESTLQIPNHSGLIKDLAGVRRRLTTIGITYVLPKTSDGRHCDFVPALALALSRMPDGAEVRAREARRAKEVGMMRQLAAHGEIDRGYVEARYGEDPRLSKSIWQRMAEARASEN